MRSLTMKTEAYKHLADLKTYDCGAETRSMCLFEDCALHPYCKGKKINLKMIRQYCVNDCMNGSTHEVKLCPATECPFHTLRMGKLSTS